jgi:hypothetical protein
MQSENSTEKPFGSTSRFRPAFAGRLRRKRRFTVTTLVLGLLGIALFAVAGGVLTFLTMQGRAKDRIESGADARQGESFAVFSVAQAFDPDYAVIWDTQLPALQLISRAGPKGMRAQQLCPFYNQSARCYPELYDGSSFGSWLEFLEKEQLIRKKTTRVFITAEGQEFLEYGVVPENVLAA